MSYIFTNALGYGMPWHQFEEKVIIDCEAHQTCEEIDNIFSNTNSDDLTIPMENIKRILCDIGYIPPFSEVQLLAKEYTDGGRRKVDIGAANDLYELVFGPDDDDPRHIIFFPNLIKRERWMRRSDYLDQMLHQYMSNGLNWRQDHILYLKEGIDNYCHYVMEPDGTPIDFSQYAFPVTEEEKRLKERTEVVPQIPSEIRWYLKKLGIMDDAGINGLRPVVAHWWS